MLQNKLLNTLAKFRMQRLAAVLAGRYRCVRFLAHQIDLLHTVVGKMTCDVQPFVAALATVADAVVYPA